MLRSLPAIIRSPRACAALPAILLLAACGASGPPAVEHLVTAADLNGLPRATVSEGSTICPGPGVADSLCPRLVATGNWLGSSVFAVWELNRPIIRFDAGTAIPLIAADTGKRYLTTIAVGPGKAPDEMIVADPIRALAIRYRKDGTVLGAEPFPAVRSISYWGYSGSVPVWQAMETSADGVTGDVVIRVGNALGDPKPRVAFRANLPWLHLINDTVRIPPPLFPNTVVYAFAPNGDVVWSDGTRFAVQKTNTDGRLLWRLTGDILGPPVDSTDIAIKSAELTAPAFAVSVPREMVDSMAGRTRGMLHPAISSLIISPDGTALVGREVLPQQDSVTYLRVGPDGIPKDQLRLPRSTQIVLFGKDSILAFRHGTVAGQSGTLFWLRVAGGQ